MIHKLMTTLLLGLFVASVALAQASTGQLCVRAFEDRNGNGTQDPNEPPIVRGVSATLADETGLIIDTGLMENSSSASTGTLCFQRLEPGQYTIRVASADYTATTPADFTAAVSDSGIPQVLSYGGQLVPVEVPMTDPALSQQDRLRATLIRSVFAGLGALIVMGAMAVVGALIYFFVLRRRSQAPTGVYAPVPAGPYPSATSTGNYPAASTPPRGVAPVDTDVPQQDDPYAMYSDDDDDTNKPAARINNEPYADVPDDDFQFAPDDEDAPFRPPEA